MPRKFTWPIFHQWNTLNNLQQCQRPWCCCQRVSFSFLTYAKITATAYQRVNLIFRCFVSRDNQILLRAYTTYVRPLLEYCTVVWPHSLKCDIHSIEKVQKKFTKWLSCCNSLYTERRNKLNLTTLESRRLYYDLVMFLILFSWNSVNS